MDELKACPYCEEFSATGFSDTSGELQTFNFCPVCGRPYNEEARKILDRRAAPENKPLTLEQLRKMNADMKNRRWVWIEVLQPFSYECKVSAYYQVQADYTRGEAFVCGYPGLSFGFDYADYGKTWLAYARKPEQEEK